MKLKSLSKTLVAALGMLAIAFTTVQAAETQYMSREDLKSSIASGQNSYVVLDLRKTVDYEKGHVATATSADIDPAMGVTGNNAKGLETLKKVLKAKTGNENGAGAKIVLVCYSGNKYAKKGTELLAEIGADAASVFTLQGGFKGWTAEEGDNDYNKLVVSGKEPGSPVK